MPEMVDSDGRVFDENGERYLAKKIIIMITFDVNVCLQNIQ